MTLTSEVSGTCLDIYADTGETVPASAVLAKIDSTFIQLDLSANNIAIDQAKRKLEQELKTLSRYTVLMKKNSTPQVTFDEVALQVDLHKLKLKKLENDKKLLQEKLARHQLKAPPGWTVIERFIEPGEYVQAGTPIAHLGDFRHLLIQLAVTYEELQALEELTTIQLELPEISRTVAAKMHQISPVFDKTTRKIPVELMIINSPDQQAKPLRGGMRAELVFPGKAVTHSFLAPASAVINRYEANWLVRPDGTELPVLLLGKIKENKQIIVSGETLSAGMVILTDPANLPQ